MDKILFLLLILVLTFSPVSKAVADTETDCTSILAEKIIQDFKKQEDVISIKKLPKEKLICEDEKSCLSLAEEGNHLAEFAIAELNARKSLCKKGADVVANKYYSKACEGGYAKSCYILGMRKMQGLGTEKNIKEVVRLYDVSCEYNIADACQNLAFFYLLGTEIPKDQNRAKMLYKKACDLGKETACSTMKQLSSMEK